MIRDLVYVVTNWNVVLKLVEIATGNIIRVSDPEAVDAGQYIGIDEIKLMIKKKL